MAFLFGIERQLSNKPVGFGTFIFVSLGSCALGIIALELSPSNAISVAGGVVAGVGFLGAGALVRSEDKTFGFTTAASIWIFSIIGLIIAFGDYLLGGVMYLAIMIVIMFDRLFELKGIGSYQRKVAINTKRIMDKDEIVRLFKGHKWKLLKFEIDKKENKSVVSYLIKGERNYVNLLKKKLVEAEWVESFKVE